MAIKQTIRGRETRAFKVRWQYADGHSEPRTMTVQAGDTNEARAIILHNHIDADSETRKSIKFLEVKVQ